MHSIGASARRFLRWLRRSFWKLLAILIVGSAVLVSVGRLLAPHADAARPLVESALGNALGQPVRIGRIEASWPRFSPQIELRDLQIGAVGEPALVVNRARVEARLYNLLRPARNSLELVVLGVNLALIQADDGRWSWRLEQGGRFGRGWERTLTTSDVLLRDAGIRVAPNGFSPLRLDVPEAHLARTGDRLSIGLRARPHETSDESIDARIELRMPDSGMTALTAYAETRGVDLVELIPTPNPAIGPGRITDMELWLDWSESDGAAGHARFDFMPPDGGDQAGSVASRMTLSARRGANGYAVEWNAVADDEAERVLVDRLTFGVLGNRTAVALDGADLEYLHGVLAPWLEDRAQWPSRLAGQLGPLELGWLPGLQFYRAAGAVRGLAVDLDAPGLSIDALDLGIGLSGDRLVIRPAGAARIGYPLLYPDPIEFDRVGGAVEWSMEAIDLRALTIENNTFELIADGEIVPALDDPRIDLVVEVPRFASSTPARWIPERGIPDMTRRWLADALVSVGSARTRTTLFGWPRGWKEHVPDGAVHSAIEFEDVALDYAPGWPGGTGLTGRLVFLAQTMDAVVDQGRVTGAPLRAPRVRIENTREAVLELDLASAGADAAELLELVRALPLTAAQPALERMRFAGGATARARVRLPVKQRENWSLDGHVEFDEVDFRLVEPELALETMSGRVPFGRTGFGPGVIDGRADGEAARVAIEAAFEPRLDLSLSGRWPVRSVIPGNWRREWPLIEQRLSGEAEFDVRLSSTGPDALSLEISSDLQGVGLALPAPLNKPASEQWPLAMRIPVGESEEPQWFDLDSRVELLVLPEAGFPQVGIGFGDRAARLPAAENFFVEGGIVALDVDGWLELVGELSRGGPDRSADRASGRKPPGSGAVSAFELPELSGWMSVEIEDLVLAGARQGPFEFALARERQFWSLRFDSDWTVGSVRLPASVGSNRTIIVQLDHLHWPQSPTQEGVDDDDAPRAAPSRLDPRGVPAIDIGIEDLRWGALALGRLELISHGSDRGLEFEQFSIERPGLSVVGSGRWIVPDPGAAPETRARFRLTLDDLGQTLDDAGYDLALERGRSVVTLDGRWLGAPLDFSLAQVEGRLDVDISDGVIPEARPGAGRLLGLVSLSAIPRRLRLDFTDVFSEGLGFDRVVGRFELGQGRAQTDDLQIDAPAASISIRGVTDLAERSYDQTLTVQPGVGSTLPIIGALTGGPLGAAAGAALQQIFDKPLRGISEVQYSVSGSWEDPVIVPVRARGIDVDGETTEGG